MKTNLEMIAAYSDTVWTFALYPDAGVDLSYPVLGLNDEIAEFGEKMFDQNDPNPDELAKELGDVYWYANAILKTLGKTLTGVAVWELNDLDPVTVNMGVDELYLQVHFAAGKIAGCQKKILRDNNQTKYELIVAHLGTLLAHLNMLAIRFGFTPLEIMNGNLTKLGSRNERGMITGDGDNR